MPEEVTSELSERLTELFVLSAALYFAGLRQTGHEDQQIVLHRVSKDLIEITPSPGEENEASLKLLRDGLCDAADMATSAGLGQIAEALKHRAVSVSGLLDDVMGSAWDERSG